MEAEFPKSESTDASGTVDLVKFDYDVARNGPRLIRNWPQKEAEPTVESKSNKRQSQRSKFDWSMVNDDVASGPQQMRWKAGPLVMC